MHAMPSVIPLSRTASMTSSVMSRTASPPAVRSSVSRWKTFTAPSSLLGRTCHDPPYSEGSGGLRHLEPSVPGAAVVVLAPVVVLGCRRLRLGIRRGAAGCSCEDDRPVHPHLAVAVDRAVHLV